MRDLSKINFERICTVLAFGLPFIVYLSTLCPTVYLVDSGEFAINLYTLGVCHPTGYPTYTLIGYIFTHIVPFGSIIMRTNLMSAICGSIACGLLFLLLKRLKVGMVAAFVAAMLFAFSTTFWSQAIITEVWTMEACFLLLILTFSIRYAEDPSPKRLCWLAFICGLSLTHHMLMALLMPFVIIHAYRSGKDYFKEPRMLVKALLCGVLGLLPYIYLPIRASMNPIINWGEPNTPVRFWYHLTGKQFRGLMFHDPLSVVWKHFVQYLALLNDQFAILVGGVHIYLLWMLPIGFYMLWKRERRLLFLLSSIWIINVIWGTNYHIIDIESYYIPSYIIASVVFAFALAWFFERSTKAKQLAAVAALFVVVGMVSGNYHSMDMSDCHLADDYSKDILRPLEKNSLLISCGDGICSALEYVQFVEGFRQDVKVIDRNLLRGWYPYTKKWSNEWYLRTIDRVDPSIARFYRNNEWSKTQIVKEVPLEIVLDHLVGKHTVYLSCNSTAFNTLPHNHYITRYIRSKYSLIPHGLVYQILPKGKEPDIKIVTHQNGDAWNKVKGLSRPCVIVENDKFANEVYQRYAQCRAVLGNCQLACGSPSDAAKSFTYAARYDPALNAAYSGLGLAQFKMNNISRAASLWKKALKINPKDEIAKAGLAGLESRKAEKS